ncbi:MAG: sigma-70 family RNA polymerase sigma factor [Pirellulaceae bacterium]
MTNGPPGVTAGVTDFPETRESLIFGVKDPANAVAWGEFSEVYRPVIYRIARAKGMQEADAQDLAQQVLLSVAAAIGNWQRDEQGTPFRHWLSRVTRNAILKMLTRGGKDHAVGGLIAMESLEQSSPVDAETSQLIDTEYRRQLYLRAASIVRLDVTPATWSAFEMTTLDGVSVEAAAERLDKSVGTIYAARSRVMRRLREAVENLENEETRS